MFRVAGGGATGNVAVMVESAFTVTTQVPAPVQAALPVPPLQSVKPVPVAVSVTTVPVWKTAVQVPAVQLIPAGFEETVPLFTSVTARVLKELPKWVVAVASGTSVSPGNNVSNPGAPKVGRGAGKLGGAADGSTIGFDPTGTPPRVSKSCDRSTTRASAKLVAPAQESAVITGAAGIPEQIVLPYRVKLIVSPELYPKLPAASVVPDKPVEVV
ncbi:MAG: hypothetical protein E8D46_15500 [Nitrospira sp.]|nr:MAG: hypothetical protein E8D46_15500 [Nitrospira sp.]